MIPGWLQFRNWHLWRSGVSVGVLSTRPPVLHLKYWRDFNLVIRALKPVLEHLRDEPAWLLFSFGWCMEYPDRIALVKQREQEHRRAFPRHRWVFLAATERELQMLQAGGLDALLCNQNCFVDEGIYTIDSRVRKDFEAVYDARLSAFKRHELASTLASLALISYVHRPGLSAEDRRYLETVRQVLPRAHWFNSPFSPFYRRLSAKAVANRLNRCRVGLCLSAEEGGMYASIQYLLCGLPVVSTPSRGGRDEFFDALNSRIAEEDPGSVEALVRDLLENPPDAHEIRARTIRRIEQHRNRLIERIGAIRRSFGNPEPYEAEWRHRFIDKMIRYVSCRSLIRTLEEGR